jgi:hypothetical protein
MVPLVKVRWRFHQQRAPDQPVIAVDIAYPYAEQQASAKAVCLTDPDAMRGVVPLQLIAVHQACMGAHQLQRARKFTDVVLAIAVRI